MTIHESGFVPEGESQLVADLAVAHFPGAMAGSAILKLVAATTKARGLTAENTLFAQSICPDEINHEEGDVSTLFTSFFGEECFHLSGLSGIPFTGKTGFGAFSHHVPDNGHAFILMSPHIGLSATHKFGLYTRDGQHKKEGAACGAAIGAFQHCCAGKAIPCLTETPDDYQMTFIIREIDKRKAIILKNEDENDQQCELARQTWEIGKKMLNTVVSSDFGGEHSTLLVLTGIQINMPRPFADFFQPLSFELQAKGKRTVDLFEETFGKKKASGTRVKGSSKCTLM